VLTKRFSATIDPEIVTPNNMMQTLFFFFCLALSLSAAIASNLRGVETDPIVDRDLGGSYDASVLCRVVNFGTMYYDEDTGGTSTEEQCMCLPIVDGVELAFEFPITLPDEIMTQYETQIDRGQLLVSVSDSLIHDKKLIMGFLPKFTVLKNTTHYRHLLERHLVVKPLMTVAVVRISTTDSTPKLTAAQLQSTLFSSTGINFVNQYNAMSFGKLKWSLAPAGVIDVRVPNSVSSYSTYMDLITAAQAQVTSKLQVSDITTIADKVLMCLPPGTGTWAASAGVNHWRAQFNNDWCTSISGTVHELGHTLGLLHSSANGVAYADRSGYMGSGYPSSTYPRKGFNGYNSWVLGWYSDRHVTVYPTKFGNRLVKIASFVDYPLASTTEYVVVNLSNKYYLQYNTQKGFNIDTEQTQNQVTVTESTTSGTDRRAGLSPGGTIFSVANFIDSGKTLTLQACKAVTGANGASVMLVSISIDGKSMCP
jgi:Gametolysin peptidase M11